MTLLTTLVAFVIALGSLILFYELGLLAVWLIERSRGKRAPASEQDAAPAP